MIKGLCEKRQFQIFKENLPYPKSMLYLLVSLVTQSVAAAAAAAAAAVFVTY
jgi:hypothetical protein